MFGQTDLDAFINCERPAGLPFLQLSELKERLIVEGWKEWIDPDSGQTSAIKQDVRIWQGASVRNCILSSGVVVGHCSEVIDSIVLNDAKLNHYVAVGRSIIGPKANLTSHVVIASRRLDGDNVLLPKQFFSDSMVSLPKFGALLGRNVVIGAHSLVNPGAVILPDAMLRPFSEQSFTDRTSFSTRIRLLWILLARSS